MKYSTPLESVVRLFCIFDAVTVIKIHCDSQPALKQSCCFVMACGGGGGVLYKIKSNLVQLHETKAALAFFQLHPQSSWLQNISSGPPSGIKRFGQGHLDFSCRGESIASSYAFQLLSQPFLLCLVSTWMKDIFI